MTFPRAHSIGNSSFRVTSIIAIAISMSIATMALGTAQSEAATTTPAPKPTISGSPRGGSDDGGFGGGQNSAAFAKYQACLTKAGIKLPAFGGFGGLNGRGTRPTGAPTTHPTAGPRPSFTLTPEQQKAFTACASLRPKFSGFGGRGGSFGKTPAPNSSSAPKGTTPKTGTSAAYIACLNARGLPVQSAAQIAGLDSQNTKVIAAEKACAGK